MQLEQAGAQLLRWIASNAISLLGGVTYTILNLTFALFGLYFLVQAPASAWQSLRPYIPFSDANANRLQERFEAVTMSTLIGTGLAAAAQGLLIALGFMWVGIPNAWFWGVVTVVFAILPVIGSGAIYVPAVIGLVMAERMGAAIFLAAWGTLVVANVDNVIRPLVYKKYAQVHPLVTLVGAIAGVSYFGLLGLLLGPLALSYFFELLRMYRDEYVTPTQAPPPGPPPAPDPPAPTPEPEPA
ncbi:MAG: AI-2E family transporter, partial [Gemmatimonadales bacterium]|nr:AI-2E family transporter [Gemmatimonadales bacterium]